MASEQSVRPGANAEYLKANLEVQPWVERFEKEGREIFDQRARILRAMETQPGMAVADVGAGTGLFTLLMANAVGPKGTVYAVDIAKEFLRHIDERARQTGTRNIRTVLCTERSVELPPNSIDLAFLCDVYHHFEYPQSSLASIHRALRKGGVLVVIDFRRVPGKSADWILGHVRAGQEIVEAEIAAAGFRKVREDGLLQQNYVLRYQKVRK